MTLPWRRLVMAIVAGWGVGLATLPGLTGLHRAEAAPSDPAALPSSPRQWTLSMPTPTATYTNDDWWILRLEYTSPTERSPGRHPVGQPMEIVRHTWDHDGGGSWDFSVGLLGRYPIRALDAPDAPGSTGRDVLASIFDRRWDAATLLATERRDARTYLRLYDWSTSHYRDAYVAGDDPSRFPPPAYATIPTGLRGEHRGRRDLAVRLYLSPIDRKLHLLDADGGVWNVGDGVRLRYSNLGGHYLNRWEVTQHGRTTKLLHFVFGQLVLADAEGVTVARADVPPALFVTRPPRDDVEWRRLGRKIDRFRPSFAPDDVRHAVQRFGRPVWTLPGAELDGFRLEPGGFRFVLRLRSTPDGVPWLADVPPGSYVITYRVGQGYRAQASSPPDLLVGAPESDAPAPELGTVFLNVPVFNRGLEDATGAAISVHAQRPGAAPSSIGTATLDVPAGERRVARLAWMPRRSDSWTLRATIGERQSAPTSIDVTPVPREELDQLLPIAPTIIVLLMLAAGAGGLAMWSAVSAAETRRLTIVLCVATLAIVGPGYYVIRSAGQWAEHDTGAFAVAIRAVLDEGTYRPSMGYQHGYVYPALAAFLTHVTGLSPGSLLGVVTPFLSAAPAVLLFALFRAFTGDRLAGAVAVLLVYLQPEYLFAVLRGSHEKFTLGLVATAMWLLVRAFQTRAQPGRRRTYVILLCLVIATALLTNALFAFAFIAVLVVVLAGSLVLAGDRPRLRLPVGRLAVGGGLIAAVSVLVVLLYPPATSDLGVATEALRKVGMLVSRSAALVNPYAYVLVGWIGPGTYLALSIANWLLLGASFACWLERGWRRFIRGARPHEPSHLLLWMFYGAYLALLAGVVVIDVTGFLASNMQHRIFPYLVLLAAPLVAGRLVDTFRRERGGFVRRAVMLGLVAAAAWCGVASLLKAANEPLLSNQWPFYTAREESALRWSDKVTRHATVWTGPTARLHSLLRVLGPSQVNANFYDEYRPDRTTRFVVSDVVRAQTVRFAVPLPDFRQENRVYDNGDAQVFHLRPRTPYQR
jgi:hypothetical protein